MNYFPNYEITKETESYATITSYVRILMDGVWYAVPIINRGAMISDIKGLVNKHLNKCYLALVHGVHPVDKEKYIDPCQLTEKERLAAQISFM